MKTHTYDVDDEIVLQIEMLARREPFEKLTFNEALSRVMNEYVRPNPRYLDKFVDQLATEGAQILSKKASSPRPLEWLKKVPELRSAGEFTTWKAICDHLEIDTAGDSARRKLKKWVELNRPDWPEVPDT